MAPSLPLQNKMGQCVSCSTAEKWGWSGMALHSLHNHSPSQHPETPLIKRTGKKKVQVYSCLTLQTRSCFWRGECLIWCDHSYTIHFMGGILTSPWDEPIRNSIRGNWGRSFFLDSNSFGLDLPKYRGSISRIKTEHAVNKAHPGRWGAQLF